MTVDTAANLPLAFVATTPPLLAPAAGFWRRAAAFGIDWTLGAIAMGVAAGLAYVRWDDSDAAATLVFLGGLWLVVPFLLALLTATGGTPGRRICGLAVVRIADGGRAGLGSALRRELLGRSLVVTPLVLLGGAGLLGYLWGTRDRLGQTWQDRIGRTTVLDVRRRPVIAQGPYGPTHVPRVAPAPGGLVYAAWWERFGAWLIDFALVLTAVATVMVSVAIAIGAARADGEEVDDTRAAIVTFAAFGATFIGMALYNAIGIGWRETTLGKQAVGLVVRAEDGSRAGYGRAFNRELLGRVLVEGLLSAFTLGLFWIASGLAAAADRKRQAWHDKMGQTMVVYGRGERRPKAEEAPLPAEADDAGLPAEDVRPAAA
jgi:uncharacterized RDD family membrane protein YckC